MYNSFFGFSRRPFSLTPDPGLLFWTAQHRRAFDLVCMALMRHAPIALVTGEVGSGKTTLVQELLREVSDDLEVALLSNVVGDSGDLLRWILTAFGEEAKPTSPAEALREVERLLRAGWDAGRRSVLIVDEAQNVSDDGIETLRLLTNLDVGKAAPLSLVLVGQPELRDRLSGERFRAFRQRLGASFHLGPMSLQETRGYVRSRLERVGGQSDLFADGAVEAIHRRSRGVPRLTNMLCDVCLVAAYGEDLLHIDGVFAELVLAEALAQGGLGGLAAEAAGAEEPARRSVASTRGADAAATLPARYPLPPATARAARPSLRVVGDAEAEKLRPTPEPPLPLSEPAPLVLHLPVPRAVDVPDPSPLSEGTVRPLARGHVMRRVLGSAAGAAVAASVAVAALVLPASETDGRPMDSAEIAVSAPPRDATAAAHQPAAAADLFETALQQAVADPPLAALGYARAAARGHSRAAYYLAQMYETGDGVPFAPGTARAWYAAAAADIDGAGARLEILAESSVPGYAALILSAREDGVAELVWEGRGPFVVELASVAGGAPAAVHATDLTAVRLEVDADLAWWRVRPAGGVPSEWWPVDNAELQAASLQ